ncbi:MmgE/PrpD family protein [Saccharothrix deserti]|uniref:MmgE/PrpD family protein n=1 Tax=Saccharothrix deserti TaxID=2593674 RepID=UPI00131C8990|nr:MmgE/PrpD family protein [Saccharothrix deserti]
MGSQLIHQLVSWAAGLRYDDIPAHTAALARSQIISNLAAVRASAAHPLGGKIVAAFGTPFEGDARQTAHVLAALSMCLEYDEVAYSGHPSASCVNVALAYAGQEQLDGRQLITAVVAANECATRFQAGMLLGSFFRGQSATYTHLLGAAVARLHAQEHKTAIWEDAVGLAFGILPTPVEHAFLNSDAKVLVAATPVRMALDACDAAVAGLAGPHDVLEGPDGVLAALSDVPMPDAVVAGLGRRWHTDTLSFKRYPASAYLQAAFECAERIAAGAGAIDPDDVAVVRVDGSILTFLLQHKAAPFLAEADTATAALTFSVGYGIATILLTGSLTTADLAGDGLRDPVRWALADKVEVRHDKNLTRRMVAATVPLGEALRQAGPRAMQVPAIAAFGDEAQELLAELGPPSESFADATMAIGARVEVELRDGTTLVEELGQATGMAGPPTRDTHQELVAAKFTASGGHADALVDLYRLDELDAGAAATAVRKALA